MFIFVSGDAKVKSKGPIQAKFRKLLPDKDNQRKNKEGRMDCHGNAAH
jgi:hypothetical protein